MIWPMFVLLCILQIAGQSQRLSDPCVCMSRSAYISDANSRVPPGLRVLIIGHTNLLRSYFPSYWMIEELGKPGFPSYLMIKSIRKT